MIRRRVRAYVRDGLIAGAVAGVTSGVPSTLHALARRDDVLASTRAAGTLVLSEDAPAWALIVAGGAAHGVISLGWGVALSFALPRRPTVRGGAVVGLTIAALDLGTLGRRRPSIRRLPLLPQLADHALFGMATAWVLSRRRGRRAPAPRTA